VKIDIFGLWVESYDLSSVASEIVSKAAGSENVLVVTPNVDHFLRWQKDSDFKKLYEQANYRLIDGMPILWLTRLLQKSDSKRITGVDLSLEIIKQANEMQIPLALIGGSEIAMKLARNNLLKSNPSLDIFFSATPSAVELRSSSYLEYLSSKLASRNQKIVLLCLGSPKQEQLYFDLNHINSLTGAFLCVGGTIDFLANLKKRAPVFVQRLGLEWFYRFIQDPFRLFRRYFISGIFIAPYFIRALIQSVFLRRRGIR
jgi:N-acetylglucosaminyldiphosphoundecaprenol N-acetyl-beta-D-mannosaminyltransferase